LDTLKELDIQKDIVQVLQTRRLTYFGHVTRMEVTAINICFCIDTHTVVVQKEDRGRSGWTTSVTTARRWALQSTRLHNLLPTGQDITEWRRNTVRHMGCQAPARPDNVIVATAISQSKSSQLWDKTW